MRDEGERFANSEYARTLKELRGIYKQASQDIEMKLASWEHAHAARVEKYRLKVETGEITQADFNAWMQGQIFQRKQWQAKKKQIAQLMIDADAEALRVMNGGRIKVFAENATFMGYQLEQNMKANYGFGVYSQRTVRMMIRENPKFLPPSKLHKGKEWEWYNKTMNDAVVQGIIQGESLTEITKRMKKELDRKSWNGVQRNVRQAYHAAQEAGKQEGLRNAERMGFQMVKRWNCKFLPGTRDAHAELHGTIVNADEPFDSLLGPIMYPGDPEAEPGNIWGCQCKIDRWAKKYPKADRGEEDKMRYEQWKAMKAEQTKNESRGKKDRSDFETWKAEVLRQHREQGIEP